jgi:hypothetical protein
MPRQTNQGKAYSVDELLKLGTIGAFGSYNGAVMGALMETKSAKIENIRLAEENEKLKTLLSEAMHDKFISEIRKTK